MAKLSHEQLITLAIAGCERCDDLLSTANTMLAESAPCPEWCARDVLLSPDFMPALLDFAHDLSDPDGRELSDQYQMALVCKSWALQWRAYLQFVHLPL